MSPFSTLFCLFLHVQSQCGKKAGNRHAFKISHKNNSISKGIFSVLIDSYSQHCSALHRSGFSRETENKQMFGFVRTSFSMFRQTIFSFIISKYQCNAVIWVCKKFVVRLCFSMATFYFHFLYQVDVPMHLLITILSHQSGSTALKTPTKTVKLR